MDSTPRRRSRHPPYVVRIIRARKRLFASGAVGLVVALALPTSWQLATRLLAAWDVGIGLYLALVYHLMSGAQADRIRQQAAMQDEGQVGILILTVAAALASLGAILVELGSSSAYGSGRQPLQLTHVTLTILLSWAFIQTIFALHYAHEFYSQNGGAGGGLAFPGDKRPDYWDFVYFSFVIGMTSQVSDVAVTCKSIRRTVAAHGVISFIFNAALLALTVNIAASAI